MRASQLDVSGKGRREPVSDRLFDILTDEGHQPVVEPHEDYAARRIRIRTGERCKTIAIDDTDAFELELELEEGECTGMVERHA